MLQGSRCTPGEAIHHFKSHHHCTDFHENDSVLCEAYNHIYSHHGYSLFQPEDGFRNPCSIFGTYAKYPQHSAAVPLNTTCCQYLRTFFHPEYSETGRELHGYFHFINRAIQDYNMCDSKDGTLGCIYFTRKLV